MLLYILDANIVLRRRPMAYIGDICLLSASFWDANMKFAGGRWPPIGNILSY